MSRNLCYTLSEHFHPSFSLPLCLLETTVNRSAFLIWRAKLTCFVNKSSIAEASNNNQLSKALQSVVNRESAAMSTDVAYCIRSETLKKKDESLLNMNRERLDWAHLKPPYNPVLMMGAALTLQETDQGYWHIVSPYAAKSTLLAITSPPFHHSASSPAHSSLLVASYIDIMEIWVKICSVL